MVLGVSLQLNRVTIKDNYIPPRVDDLLARIPQNCVFSKVDLEKAFFQIPIRPEDQAKTAVITPFGLYEYIVMPMGLKMHHKRYRDMSTQL